MVRAGDQYYCKECGLIKQEDLAAVTTTTKRKEQTGPKIPSRTVNNKRIFFKSIRFTQTQPDRPKNKLQELFDRENEQEEAMLKSGGCIIATDYDEVVR